MQVSLSGTPVSYKSSEEKELDRQYSEYRAQFEAWKEKNKHLEATGTYRQYVEQFLTWEKEVEKRRTAIRARRAAKEREKAAAAAAANASPKSPASSKSHSHSHSHSHSSSPSQPTQPSPAKALPVQTGTLPPHIQHQVQAAAQKQLQLHQQKMAAQAAAAAAAVGRRAPDGGRRGARSPDHSLSQMTAAVASGAPLPSAPQSQQQHPPIGPQQPQPPATGTPNANGGEDMGTMMGMMMGMMGMMMQMVGGAGGSDPATASQPPPTANGGPPPPAMNGHGGPPPPLPFNPHQPPPSFAQPPPPANGLPFAQPPPPATNGQASRDRAARAERSFPPVPPRGWRGREKDAEMFGRWGHRADAPDKCPPVWDGWPPAPGEPLPRGWVRGEPIRKEPRPLGPPPREYRGGRGPAFKDFSVR